MTHALGAYKSYDGQSKPYAAEQWEPTLPDKGGGCEGGNAISKGKVTAVFESCGFVAEVSDSFGPCMKGEIKKFKF